MDRHAAARAQLVDGAIGTLGDQPIRRVVMKAIDLAQAEAEGDSPLLQGRGRAAIAAKGWGNPVAPTPTPPLKERGLRGA